MVAGLVALANVPVPPDHRKVALVPEPLSVAAALARMVLALPAETVGAGVTLMVTVLMAGVAHGELGWAVSVSTTLPLVMVGV